MMGTLQKLVSPVLTTALAIVAPLLMALQAAYNFICWALFVPLEKLLQHTPAGAILGRFTHEDDCLEHMARETTKMKATADNLLVHDKRREFAETILPPAKHPSWYTNVPKHLRKSVVAHGRLRETGLAPARLLAGNSLTPEFVQRAWRAAIQAGVRAGWLVFIFAAVLAYMYGDVGSTWSGMRAGSSASFSQADSDKGDLAKRVKEDGIRSLSPEDASRFVGSLSSGERQQLGFILSADDKKWLANAMRQQQPRATANTGGGIDAYSVARSYNDVWSSEDVAGVSEKLRAASNTGNLGAEWAGKATAVVAAPLRVALLALAAFLAAVAAARMTFIGRMGWLVHTAVDERVGNLRKAFREALQRWRYFLNDRKTNDKGYNDQVHFATQIDRSPLIYFGEAEGMTEFAGHVLGPREGHEMKQSIVDMLQHTMVLGGSGESKSRDFYIPLLAQLLELRKAGYPIATYITDEKGAIVDDAKKVVAKLGMEKDLLIIGTGDDEWRVDLMDVGRPYLVAEFIKSAARQAGAGQAGEDFWPEMGNDLGLNLWTVTEVGQHTKAGQEWEKENGIRFHSIKNMLSLAISDEHLEKTIAMVAAALKSPEEYRRIAHLDDDALHGAMEYLLDQWLPMADVTRDGIKANLRKALRTFTFKPEIARGFADGAGEKLLPASEMHSNRIKVLNVSQIEHGSAGRLVNIMLKTAFFKQCRDVQQQNPSFIDERLAWWFNPDLSNPKKDSYYLEFFLADEYQSLITADATSGYSDLTVWNVLRSAGVAGVTISQGLGAYETAIGKEGAANILRQWRSKHFLRTEDTATIEEAKKLLGKTMRFHVSDWSHYESLAAIRAELGTDPDNLQPVRWRASFDVPSLLGKSRHGSMDFGSWDDAFDFDDRFVMESSAMTAGSPNGINAATATASKQQAAWRMEDRQIQAMQHGVLDTEVLRDEQIMEMTRGRSLSLIQAAGGTIADIMRLNAAAYRRYTDEEMAA